MLRIIGYTILLYLALKACRFMVRPAVGHGRDDVSLGTIIRAGEPMLLIGTFGLSMLLTICATWWLHQFNQGYYTYSTDCYAKMAASHHLPGRPARFSSFDAADKARGYVYFAELHGAKLGMARAAIDKKLTQAMTAQSSYYASLATTNSRQKIAASFQDLDRCLNGEGHPRGELLTPNA